MENHPSKKRLAEPQPARLRRDIAKMTKAEYQLYRVEVEARKRNKQLRRRQDALDRPNQSGGYQTITPQ